MTRTAGSSSSRSAPAVRPSRRSASGTWRSTRRSTRPSTSTCAAEDDGILRAVPLQLTVDGERWRTHLRRVADAQPGLVPVAKGNGYGFGLGRLARKADWLGVEALAVGTYEEL